ncbi:hypothetical protein NQZ68_026975 [Dissostichus eleginoides]|nr:hypothetical protein NQZ68_026975 [Dissostichus eleginoides]
MMTLGDWRLQRLKEQKEHAGVRLNKALSTPGLSGDYKAEAAPLNTPRIQSSARSRRQNPWHQTHPDKPEWRALSGLLITVIDMEESGAGCQKPQKKKERTLSLCR